MKKFILPALLSIILLTSCSQALYKNKYDWVKVERQPTTLVKDMLRKSTEVVQTVRSIDKPAHSFSGSTDSASSQIYSTANDATTQEVIVTPLKSDENSLNDYERAITTSSESGANLHVTAHRVRVETQTSGKSHWPGTLPWTVGFVLVFVQLYAMLGPASILVVVLTAIGIGILALLVLGLLIWLAFWLLLELIIACIG